MVAETFNEKSSWISLLSQSTRPRSSVPLSPSPINTRQSIHSINELSRLVQLRGPPTPPRRLKIGNLKENQIDVPEMKLPSKLNSIDMNDSSNVLSTDDFVVGLVRKLVYK